jgi:hypothetical protein
MPPKISIAIPTHKMKNGDFFLKRCLDSIREQTYQNYEIVITDKGKMAQNTNRAIKQCTGELVKVMYMDDYFAHKDALKNIVENFEGYWMITGADTNPHPYWTNDIEEGNNKLGSPSALTMRKGLGVLFDERLSWLLDCDLYRRLYDIYGEPTILDEVNVKIGIHDGQMTNILTDEEKLAEHNLMKEKYETY